MADVTGWGRGTWSEGSWGEALPVTVSGISASSSIGSVTIGIGQDVSATGLSLSANIGEESISIGINVLVSGLSLQASIGTVEALSLSGISAQTNVGTVDIQAGGNVFVTAAENGLQTSVGQASEIITVDVFPNGISATINIGEETPQADADVEVTNSAPLFQFTAEGNAALSTDQFKFGTASLELDGTDDYIETTTNLDLSSGDFTIDLWIRPDNVTGYKGIWQSGTSTTEQSYLLGNTVYWTVTPSTIITSSVTVNASEWTMLSYERQGNTHRIYKNGTLEDTATTANKQDNGPFSVGKNGFGDFDGYIDEVRVSDVARYEGSSFTEPTSEFEFDSNTNVLIHLDGADGSTDIKSADDTLFTATTAISSVEAIPGVFVDITGIQLTTSIGEETPAGNANVPVTGQSLSTAIGEVDAVSIVEVTGISLTANIGSVTPRADIDVSATGIELSISIENANVIAWAEVDTGTQVTWTEVDLAA